MENVIENAVIEAMKRAEKKILEQNAVKIPVKDLSERTPQIIEITRRYWIL